MYTPAAYLEERPRIIHQAMRAWSFATLVSTGADGPVATHLPMLVDERPDAPPRLVTHMARNNEQWRHFIGGETPALAIFQGPHAFISPSWYEDRMTFPTWNYAAIHGIGRPRLVEEPEEILAVLRRTVALWDTPLGGPWSFAAMPDALILPRLERIVAIDMPLDRVEAKFKLNQDKTAADRAGVIAALDAAGDDQARAMAAMLRAFETEGADAPGGATLSGR
ncbi:FMN-binding negative transcriptional regulator (plasmid) [Tistrella mobilis]|uniref:FMN-binding negative transcriptional regulator n=1 Tax=Tistrella mobilis TaxID=171437 RepID=A0A161Q6Y0_9PROT|nr:MULTISPECIES: FMN-binding negative transcriptional regulator [Tistrella]KYO55806.1 hypothetical protein AUP44_22895 [Tistrella mobilis]MAD37769.1 FMN-binding negative transcriptional regulator [Tistrella sp.]HAE48033.1 FMN-binding negative transcriptional regulator [Tistrella mobilis]